MLTCLRRVPVVPLQYLLIKKLVSNKIRTLVVNSLVDSTTKGPILNQILKDIEPYADGTKHHKSGNMFSGTSH